MSYDSWLDGALALDPFPDAGQAEAIRAALADHRDSSGGRLSLTPLGHGLVSEGATDWEVAVASIEKAGASVFKPVGIALSGSLRAMGEDGLHLATIFVEAGSIRVERQELDDEPTPDDWLAALQDEDPAVRREAAAALAGTPEDEVMEALAAAASSDDDEAVRCQALESLGNIGEASASALEPIVECLGDESPTVRYWATFALGRLGPAAASAVPALEKLSTDQADGPRYGAMDALRRIRATAT